MSVYLSVCLSACLSAYLCVCACVCVCVRVCACVCVCDCMCDCVCDCVCTHACVCTCVYGFLRMCPICMSVYAHSMPVCMECMHIRVYENGNGERYLRLLPAPFRMHTCEIVKTYSLDDESIGVHDDVCTMIY